MKAQFADLGNTPLTSRLPALASSSPKRSVREVRNSESVVREIRPLRLTWRGLETRTVKMM
jgi:hypothetical protein